MTIQNIADRELPQSITKLLEREGTGISWADLTYNPWIGCQKVSPACDFCYAEDLATARLGVTWGPGAPRRRTARSTLRAPLRWNKIAAEAQTRLRVFCLSLGDWADNAVDDAWRTELAHTIILTPWLDYMLLTKRIGNAEKMLRAMFPDGVPPNVWLGITVCNQEEADRDVARAVAVKRALGISKLFLSCEPLLGGLNLEPWLGDIDLVICGGESGPHARPIHPDWAGSLRDQCAAAGVAFHFKQWGEFFPVFDRDKEDPDWRNCSRWEQQHPKGRWLNLAGGHGFHGDRVVYVDRPGVRKAGHLLDGKEHREIPA